VREKRTNKSKGFGFVSFMDVADFSKALREMNGKYIGNRWAVLRDTAARCSLLRGGWSSGGGPRARARAPPGWAEQQGRPPPAPCRTRRPCKLSKSTWDDRAGVKPGQKRKQGGGGGGQQQKKQFGGAGILHK
jgi:RNA recognition motif-containing protein